MFFNYLKLAVRNLLRQRGYSLINILGLSIGLTISLLMLLWVQDERQMDQFHQEGEQVYRLLANINMGEGGIQTWENVPYPLIQHLREKAPEVDLVGAYDPTNKKQFEVAGRTFLEDGIYATASFFDILTFPFVAGNPQTAFQHPNAIILTESLTQKLFGPDWQGSVIGQSLSINGQDDYTVGAVLKDLPLHSSLQFDFVLDLDRQYSQQRGDYAWGSYSSKVVCKLKNKALATRFQERIANIIADRSPSNEGIELIAQPFARQYLHGRFVSGEEAGGRVEYVRLFGLAAFFLILIACINFMNLATAKATQRAKEVGVRKTIGAQRGALITQFMVEAGLLTSISIALALFGCAVLLPAFQELSGKMIQLDFSSLSFWSLLAVVGIGTALLAGSYPAFFLSSFKTIQVLKGQLTYHFGGKQIRRGLVVVQFALSALLIVGALVVREQVDFIKNKHLGLEKENILYFRTPGNLAGADQQTFANELSRIPGIESITFTDGNPLSVGSQTGDPTWEGMTPGGEQLFSVLISDENFLNTMKIPLASGRNFSSLLSTDTTTFLINETAAALMQLKDPLGKQVKFWGIQGPIIGVVKDFHINSLHEKIRPLILINQPAETSLTMMRIDPSQTEAIIASTQTIFQQFNNGSPFRYDFLDQRFLQRYKSEQRTSKLARWFALVALLISCLGLFGLSAFIAEQKAKEIGIRKVLGATTTHIAIRLTRQFLGLVFLALLIALPLSWYLMSGWLADFAYRIELSWQIFIVAGILALVVAIATVGFQSIKAALVNPIHSLKDE